MSGTPLSFLHQAFRRRPLRSASLPPKTTGASPGVLDARQMSGCFSLDKVGLVAIVARLKKRSRDAVLRTSASAFLPGPVVAARGRAQNLGPERRVEDRIREIFEKSAAITVRFGNENAVRIAEVARQMAGVLKNGGKILLCGNGGSAADAQHLAAEFVNRFQRDRGALAAIALTTDTSALTSIGNDLGFDRIFSRQIEALGRPGDLLIAISTSGNSPNVLRAVEAARGLGIATVGLCGGTGGALAASTNEAFVVPSGETPRIQEAHITLGHVWCALTEDLLASASDGYPSTGGTDR